MKKENINIANYTCDRLKRIDDELNGLKDTLSFKFQKERFSIRGRFTSLDIYINDDKLNSYIKEELKRLLLEEKEELLKKLETL